MPYSSYSRTFWGKEARRGSDSRGLMQVLHLLEQLQHEIRGSWCKCGKHPTCIPSSEQAPRFRGEEQNVRLYQSHWRHMVQDHADRRLCNDDQFVLIRFDRVLRPSHNMPVEDDKGLGHTLAGDSITQICLHILTELCNVTGSAITLKKLWRALASTFEDKNKMDTFIRIGGTGDQSRKLRGAIANLINLW